MTLVGGTQSHTKTGIRCIGFALAGLATLGILSSRIVVLQNTDLEEGLRSQEIESAAPMGTSEKTEHCKKRKRETPKPKAAKGRTNKNKPQSDHAPCQG